MIGKTNCKAAQSLPCEFVNIRLVSNQSEHSALVGVTFSVSYESFSEEYIWNGSEVTVQIPAYVTYLIEFGDAEGYNTPEPIIYEAVEDNARTIEAIYTCELLTINVGADEGTPEGYEVAIYKRDKIDLPSEYTFLEYIESSGTQYINTGFKPNQDTRVVISADFAARNTTQGLFGQSTNLSSKRYEFLENGTNFYSPYNNGAGSLFTLSDSRILIDKNKNTTIVNGTTVVTHTYSAFQATNNMYLFALNRNGSVSSACYAKVYYCQIYDNGILIRDYVPVKNSSGVAGLYDMANGVFYKSASTTNFTAGSEIANPFTWLDYIESDGNQWIDTKFNVSAETEVICDFQYTYTPTSTERLFSNDNNFGFGWQSTGVFRSWGGSAANFSMSATDRHVLHKKSTECILDETKMTTTAHSAVTDYTLPLFARNSSGTIDQYSKVKLYSFQLYDNGALVRDYIPASRYDGSVGLYDKVSSKFYSSVSGTNFIAGDEVSLMGEIIAIQTTTTGSYKIPFGVTYTVTASSVDGFETPASVIRTANQSRYSIDMKYVARTGTQNPTNGVYIQDTDGYFHTKDEWDGSYTPNGIAIITSNCRFVMALEDAYTGHCRWGGSGIEVSGITTTINTNTAQTDYDGEAQTTTIINALKGTNDGYADGAPAAEYCRAYTFPDGSIGYLGAVGEWQAAVSNISAVNSALSKCGGASMHGYYWTSTQYNSKSSWVMYWDMEGFGTNTKHNNSDHVRAFCSI